MGDCFSCIGDMDWTDIMMIQGGLLSTATSNVKKVAFMVLFSANLLLTCVDVIIETKSLSEAKESLSSGINISSSDCPQPASFCYNRSLDCNFIGEITIVNPDNHTEGSALQIWDWSHYIFCIFIFPHESVFVIWFFLLLCNQKISARISKKQMCGKCYVYITGILFTPMPIIKSLVLAGISYGQLHFATYNHFNCLVFLDGSTSLITQIFLFVTSFAGYIWIWFRVLSKPLLCDSSCKNRILSFFRYFDFMLSGITLAFITINLAIEINYDSYIVVSIEWFGLFHAIALWSLIALVPWFVVVYFKCCQMLKKCNQPRHHQQEPPSQKTAAYVVELDESAPQTGYGHYNEALE